MYNISEGQDFGYKGNKPGFYDEKGNWSPLAKDFPKGELQKLEADYIKRRGKSKIEADLKRHEAEKAKQEKARRQQSQGAQGAQGGRPAPPAAPGAQGSRPPVAAPPTSTPPGPRNDRRTAPPASPVRQTPPQASPVAQYMKAAAAARKSGDPAEMAKVRDMGMEIWRKSNPKLAAAADEKARIRGTAQTDNPLMKDMRDRLPLTPSVQSPTLKKDLGNLASNYTRLTQNPNAAIGATPKPASSTPAAGSALAGNQVKPAFSGTALSSAKPTGASDMSGATVTNRTPVAYKPELMKDKGSGLNPPSNTIGDTKSEVLKKGLLKKGDPGWANNARYNVKEGYDAYDLVLEHLLSEGHADTVDEANYVMMQMSAEHIQNIVEQEGFRSDGRYQLPDGRTMGPIPGAIRALFTGNLPKSRTYIPPSTQTPTNRPPAVPASKDDSGRLTDFGAGGGKAKLKQGMTVGQVERQGRRNMGDYSG